MLKKVMLACGLKDLTKLKYPLVVSPKIDGVRAIVQGGQLLSRTLKPIPNKYTQKLFSKLPDGFDGELVVGETTDPDCFRKTTSGVMSIEGEPNVHFYVFDYINKRNKEDTFTQRSETLVFHLMTLDSPGVKVVPYNYARSVGDVEEEEKWYLERGFEGLILRDPEGLYKQGRSTLKEGLLMKLKRFTDSEGTVTGYAEVISDTKKGMVGALHAKDLETGVEFSLGTGFKEEERIL